MDSETQADPRADRDRLERYAPRHQWLPHREHRGYACDGDVDAFGDESLYRASSLGTATIEPAEVEVGACAPLVLTFTAGPAGIPEGTRLAFAMRGQNPLGHLPDFVLTYQCACQLEKKGRGFTIVRGCLQPGEQVALSWPPFSWTPLAGRREFKVIFHFGSKHPEQRLPEPVVVRVLPKPMSRLEATLPCSHRPGQAIRLRVTARDPFDNRALASCDARWAIPGEDVSSNQPLRLVDGIATRRINPPGHAVTRVSVAPLQGEGACLSNPSLAVDGPQLYVGDLHCHDYLSEAEGYPDEVYRWAIEDRCLDFVSVVPQSHGWHDNETWAITKYMNERFLEEGRFVTFLGFEWQHTGYGDKVIHYLGGDQPYLPRDDARYASPAGLYAALRESDALVISHHPCYPARSWCSSTDFTAVETDVERLVELWSMHGSSEGYDPADRPLLQADPDRTAMAALRRGLRIGFTAGSDTHSARPGGSAKEPLPHWGGLTAVWADSLTRRGLFRALRARRTYALTRARIILRFTVNGHPMGSEIGPSDSIHIQADAWAPGPIAKVEILKNAALLRSIDQHAEECHLQMEDHPAGPAFYHCRITLRDGNLAVCSPVWVG